MEDQSGKLIDGTARARHWRGARPRSADEDGVETRSEAPKSIASSLLVPAEMLDPVVPPRSEADGLASVTTRGLGSRQSISCAGGVRHGRGSESRPKDGALGTGGAAVAAFRWERPPSVAVDSCCRACVGRYRGGGSRDRLVGGIRVFSPRTRRVDRGLRAPGCNRAGERKAVRVKPLRGDQIDLTIAVQRFGAYGRASVPCRRLQELAERCVVQ